MKRINNVGGSFKHYISIRKALIDFLAKKPNAANIEIS